MSQEFIDKINNLLFNFRDLTSMGSPGVTSIQLLDDETVYKISPERYSFYMQLIESITNPNSKIAEAVLKKYNLTRYNRDAIDKRLQSIQKYIEGNQSNYAQLDEKGEKLEALATAANAEALKKKSVDLIKDLAAKLKANPLTNDLDVPIPKDQTGGTANIDQLKEYLFGKAPPPTGQVNNVAQPDQVLAAEFNKIQDIKQKDAIISKFMNNPYYSPDNEKMLWSDRAIFIAVTYVIRSIAIFMVEWSIYSGYITDFKGAFALYFGMYVMVYIIILYLVNSHQDDKLFKFLFFYMNVYSTDRGGWLRNGVHLLCILLFLPIPFIVKEYREFTKSEVLSFREKKGILNGVDKFSLYVWLLTSVIALNV